MPQIADKGVQLIGMDGIDSSLLNCKELMFLCNNNSATRLNVVIVWHRKH